MKAEEVRSILGKEADKYRGFADECNNRGDRDLALYWWGKRRGVLDALKYLDRMEASE